MKIRLLIISLISVVLVACGNASSRNAGEVSGPKINSPEIAIVMHRGLCLEEKLAPENSLDALSFAGRVGARYVEIDVFLTKDDEIILFHDNTINRLCRNKNDYSVVNEEVECRNLTLAELRNNYVLAAQDPSMRRPVPTLREGLLICRQEGIHPYIELKEGIFKDKTVKKAYDLAVQILGRGNFSFTSPEKSVVKYLRGLDAQLSLYCDHLEDIDFFRKYNVNYYPHFLAIKQGCLDAVHKAGLSATTWTIWNSCFDSISTKGFDAILVEDVAPNFDPGYAIFRDNTNGKFENYEVGGIINDGIVSLRNGQEMKLKEVVPDTLYLGALYFTIEAKGKFEIETDRFKTERDNKSDDFQIYKFQYIFHKDKPLFKIKALDENLEIKSVWLAICEY